MLTDHSTSAPSPRKTEPFAAIPHTACISDLSDAAYRVLGAVLFFARRGSCDATDQQLGARCGKSAPAIQRSLKELEAKGWIERLGSGQLPLPLKWGGLSRYSTRGFSMSFRDHRPIDCDPAGVFRPGTAHRSRGAN